MQAEINQVFDEPGIGRILVLDRFRPGGHGKSRLKIQAVVFELDPGIFEGHVYAALYIPGQRDHLHPLIIVAGYKLVVDNLHLDFRRVGTDKTCVHHVLGLDIAAAVEFSLPLGKSHLLADGRHGTACPRHGEADVVPVDPGRPPVEASVACVSDKPQAGIFLVADLAHDAAQGVDIAFRYHGLALFKQDRIDAA